MDSVSGMDVWRLHVSRSKHVKLEKSIMKKQKKISKYHAEERISKEAQ